VSDYEELSLSNLRREYEELRCDYLAFTQAYDIVCQRINQSTERIPTRSPLLHTWSGSRAVCGALELSIHAIERTMHGYDELIRKVEAGEIKNSDRPTLVVVDGGTE
jgi:hypothetical protein